MGDTVDADDYVRLANELRPILMRLARHLRTEAHASGLTAGQVALLVAIEFNPEMTSQQLAVREGLSDAGVSGHLARLEGKGFIRRERSADGRRVNIFLTSDGLLALRAVREQRTTWLTQRIGALSRSDRELLQASLPALDHVSLGDR
jgi:DNA-binding MarR family transcriptional regulator